MINRKQFQQVIADPDYVRESKPDAEAAGN